MFQAYLGDAAVVVTEHGVSITVPNELLLAAGLRNLRTGQRLIVSLDSDENPYGVRLP